MEDKKELCVPFLVLTDPYLNYFKISGQISKALSSTFSSFKYCLVSRKSCTGILSRCMSYSITLQFPPYSLEMKILLSITCKMTLHGLE